MSFMMLEHGGVRPQALFGSERRAIRSAIRRLLSSVRCRTAPSRLRG